MKQKILQTTKVLILLIAVILTQIPLRNVDAATTYTNGYWQYEKITSTQVRIIGYTGSATKVVVPNKLGSYKVTEIGNNVFKSNRTVKSIEISEGITKIGSYFAAYASNLETLIIPVSLEYISIGFCNYTKLTNIQLSEYGKLDYDFQYPTSKLNFLEIGSFLGTPLISSNKTIIIGEYLINFYDTRTFSTYDLSTLKVRQFYTNSLKNIKASTLILPKNAKLYSNCIDTNQYIKTLQIKDNTSISSSFMQKNNNITTLKISGCSISSGIFNNYPKLTTLTLTNCTLSSNSITNNPLLKTVNIDGCSLSENSINNCQSIESMTIKNIKELTVKFLNNSPKLKYLTMTDVEKKYMHIFENTLYIEDRLVAEKNRILNASGVTSYLNGKDRTKLKPIEKAHVAKLLRNYCTQIWKYNSNKPDHGSIEACMLDREAACLGLSRGYEYVLEAAGVNSCILNGRTHAWNYIQLDSDMWFHIDMTTAVQSHRDLKTYYAGERFIVSDSLRYQAEPNNVNPAVYWDHIVSYNQNCTLTSHKTNGTLFKERTKYAMGDITLTKDSSHSGAYSQVVDSNDINLLKKYLLGDCTFTEKQKVLADMNFDGEVDIVDLVVMLQYVNSQELKTRTIY